MVTIVLNAWLQLFLHMPILMRKRRQIQKSKKVSSTDVRKWLDDYQADQNKIIYGMRSQS